MSDIHDVAKLARVSIATVSNAMNSPEKLSPKTLERVLVAAAKLDYRPNRMAKSLASSKTHMIGIVVSDIYNPGYTRAIHAMSLYFEDHGYSTMLINTDMSYEKEIEAVNRLIEYKVDGVIINGTAAITRQVHVKKLAERGIPVVLTNRESNDADVVMPNFQVAVKTMLTMLKKLGHREMGIIVPPIYDAEGFPTSRYARLDITLSTLRDMEFSIDPHNISVVHEASFNGGLRMIQSWIDSGRKIPSALFVMRDDVALGVIKGLQRNGYRVPEDVSVCGFSNYNYCQYSTPTLSSISSREDVQGKLAAQLILERIENPDMQKKAVEYDCEFVARESIGPARKENVTNK